MKKTHLLRVNLLLVLATAFSFAIGQTFESDVAQIKQMQQKIINEAVIEDVFKPNKCQVLEKDGVYYAVGEIVADNHIGHLERRWYDYDILGNEILAEREKWDTGAEKWKGNTRKTTTYNESNLVHVIISENFRNDSWVVFHKETHTYDEKGNEISVCGDNFKDGVWVNYYRHTYTYNSNNDRLTFLREEKNANGEWVSKYKYTHEYNDKNLQTSLIDERWDVASNTWYKSVDYKYTYDEKDNGTFYVKKIFNKTGVITEGIEHTWTYDNNNNILTYAFKDWNGTEWVTKDKTTYTYDSKNNMLTDLLQRWNGTAWQNMGRLTYAYDQNNNLLSTIKEQYQNDMWTNVSKNSLTYNDKNHVLTFIFEIWNNDIWNKYTRGTRTYNDNGGILSEESFGWDDAREWVPIDRRNYTYDANYNLTRNLYEKLGQGEVWKIFSDDSWAYENDNANVAKAIAAPQGHVNMKLYFNNMKSIYGEGSGETLMLVGKTFEVNARYVKIGKEEEPVKDIEITEIVKPTGTAFSKQEVVTIKVKNLGDVIVKDIPVEVTVNGKIATGVIAQELAFGESAEYTFAEKFDMSEIGKYTIVAKVTLEGDKNPENNQKTVEFEHKANIDIAIVKNLIAPKTGLLTANEIVTFKMKNNSNVAIKDIIAECNINGNTITETISTIIPVGGELEYSFVATFDMSKAGDYKVKITLKLDGDVDTKNNEYSTTIKNTLVGIEQVDVNVSIYPNPATDYINVNVCESQIEGINIYDISGKMIVNMNSINNQSVRVPVSQLQGLYLLEIITSKNKIVSKINIK